MEFSIVIALQKVLKNVIQLGVAWLASMPILTKLGITINQDVMTLGALSASIAIVEFIRGFIKRKFGVKWL